MQHSIRSYTFNLIIIIVVVTIIIIVVGWAIVSFELFDMDEDDGRVDYSTIMLVTASLL